MEDDEGELEADGSRCERFFSSEVCFNVNEAPVCTGIV